VARQNRRRVHELCRLTDLVIFATQHGTIWVGLNQQPPIERRPSVTAGASPNFDVASNTFLIDGRGPTLSGKVHCSRFSGWWCPDEKERLLAELNRETDARKRKAIIDRVQTLFYEDVGQIKFGDMFGMMVVRKELRGDFRSTPGVFFWNAWLEKK